MAALDTALAEAIEGLSDEATSALKLVFGRVMGEIACEVVNPAIQAFPALEPDDATWISIAKARAASRASHGL